MSEFLHVWVRSDTGKVYGPLSPPSIELLIDNGIIAGRMQVSTDGENFVFPGRIPGLRMIFPKETWGDTVVAGDELDAKWSEVVLPPERVESEAASGFTPMASSPTPPPIGGVPVAGPGTRSGVRPVSSASGLRPVLKVTPTPVPTLAPSIAPSIAPPKPSTSSTAGLDMAGPQTIPPSGTLASLSAPQLYSLAAQGELTGLVRLSLADRQLLVHFRKGNPEFVDSSHPEDSLAHFLLAQRLITQAQIDQAKAQIARFGGELLAALFGLGLLNPNSVFELLGQRASQLLTKFLAAEHGNFTFELQELSATKAMPLGNKWAVYLAALRRVPAVDLRRRMSSMLDMPIMKSAGQVAIADVRMTPQEMRAFHYFDGVRSLSQLMNDVPTESDTILRTAWMVKPLDLVSFAKVTVRAPRDVPPPKSSSSGIVQAPPVVTASPGIKTSSPSSVAPPPAPAPLVKSSLTPAPISSRPSGLARAAAAAGNFELEAKHLRTLYEEMKRRNFFDVLGLPKEADKTAVKLAYLKAARSFHPDTVPQGAPDSLAKAKADIFALIGDAYRTLFDDSLRKDYVGELSSGGTGSKVDLEQILRGEDLFHRGRLLVQARKYPEALKMFEDAIASNDQEGEFYAWRGYTRYLVSTDRKSEAVRDLKTCLSLNPNVAPAYYFLGFIAKSSGDLKTANGYFTKCVALDPKHIDAQRELRSMKK